ncbi:MAG: hypothetical protein GOMPHAMPRED_004897 [Gomphillus americanus]|uniref:Uncharacterized protein n=1 Tax=Gomphillus americanus TaxID=1940652 RepID=A0A8H3HXN9_9LECA|nr:MAG: hypothetical protein GOMPHAMPRED_004897 [Gomphillus americanus]
MSCKRGSIALSKALRCVFISKATSRTPSRSINSLPHGIPSRNSGNSFSSRREPTPVDPKKFGPADYILKLKDEDIPALMVTVKDDQGNLGMPQFKSDVLKSFDRKAFFLVQLSKDDDFNDPICKIIPRATFFAQEKASNIMKRNNVSKERKEIEIPWKAAEADVDRKLRVANDLLEKGKKADVVIIARRPREIVQDKEEAQAIVNRISEKIANMQGVKGTIDVGGVMGKVITIHLEALVKQQQQQHDNKKLERNAKAIEITWTITDDEIGKKRLRVEQLLASGIPVDLIINSRRKAFEIPEQEGNKVLTRVWAALAKIRGIQEVQPREGAPGKMVTLYLGIGSAS